MNKTKTISNLKKIAAGGHNLGSEDERNTFFRTFEILFNLESTKGKILPGKTARKIEEDKENPFRNNSADITGFCLISGTEDKEKKHAPFPQGMLKAWATEALYHLHRQRGFPAEAA